MWYNLKINNTKLNLNCTMNNNHAKSNLLSVVGLLTLLAVNSCCKRQQEPVGCNSPKIYKYGSCVYDSTKGTFVNGEWVSFGSTTLGEGMQLWQPTANNCSDWRDSIFIGNSIFDSTNDGIWLFQYPTSSQPNHIRSTVAWLSKYKVGTYYDSFECALATLSYGSGSLGKSINTAFEGRINKAADSINLRLYNVTIGPNQIFYNDYCDKLLLKR
jgi:hypothetical protein